MRNKGALLLFLVPAVALAAFPFFSSFAPAKALVAGVVLAVALVRPRLAAPDPGLILALSYLAVSLPSVLFPASARQAVLASHLDLVGVAVFLVAGASAQEGRFGERLAAWGSGTILLVVVPAAIEVVIGRPLLGYALLAGGGTLGNPDLAAELVAMALPAALWGTFSLRGVARGLAVAASLGAVLLLALVPSVTARLAAAGVVVVLASMGLSWLRIRPGRGGWPGTRVVLPLLAAGVLAGIILAATVTWGEGRLYLVRVGLDCALEQPLTGQGVGAFPGCFLEHQARTVAAAPDLLPLWTNARHAHDEWLHLWVERGLLPPLVLLLLFGYALARAVRAGFGAGGSGFGQAGLAAAGIIAAGVCATGSVSLAHYPGRILAFLWLGLACAPAPGTTARGEEGDDSTVRRFARWLAWPAALFLAAAPLWMVSVDALYVNGGYRTALLLDPWHSGAALQRGLDEIESGNIEAGCGLVERALSVSPDVNTAVAAGVCRARNGNLGRAIQHLETAVRWHPRFGTAHANLAELYRLAGRKEEAWRHITRAVSLWPGRKDFRAIRRAVCTDNPFCLPDPR